MSLKRLASAAAVLATVAGGLALTATAASADTTDQVSKADVARTAAALARRLRDMGRILTTDQATVAEVVPVPKQVE